MLRKKHEDNHNEGTEYVRSLVQPRFWVTGPRNVLRSIKSKCSKGIILLVQLIQLHKVDLPIERVEGNVYPFRNTGVDEFGPFENTVLGRPMKPWCCLFTCLITRSVNIEVVNGLDTNALNGDH